MDKSNFYLGISFFCFLIVFLLLLYIPSVFKEDTLKNMSCDTINNTINECYESIFTSKYYCDEKISNFVIANNCYGGKNYG